MLMKSSDGLGIVDLNVLNDLEKETDETPTASTEIKKENYTPAERLENSKIVSLIIGVLGLSFIVYHFMQNGLDLNINIVNFIVLFLGIIFHQTPRRFLDSVTSAVKNASGIIVQFPFYAGIMGMMVASGLSEQMSLWFVSISTEFTFPVLAFISTGIVNFFVPSGVVQWAIQGRSEEHTSELQSRGHLVCRLLLE